MSDASKAKKTRLSGSCDVCRRRKVKCNSATLPPGSRCTSCVSLNTDCTHTAPLKKRGPRAGYVAYLEDRVKSLELVRGSSQPLSSDTPAESSDAPPPLVLPSNLEPHDSLHPSNEEPESPRVEISDTILATEGNKEKYFGSSSGHALMVIALLVKKANLGDKAPRTLPSQPYKRPQFWNRTPSNWEWPGGFIFPDSNRSSTLMALYFSKVHIIFPIIHRPSFERAVHNGHHLNDPEVGAILLLVCALGMMYTDDEETERWQLFDQVKAYRKTLSSNFSVLHEMQYYCLAALCQQAAFSPMPTWSLIGDGIRYAVDIGLHRRKPKNHEWTFEDELKKRAFWALVTMDRLCNNFINRPLFIPDEDLDLEYPLDDEYWEKNRSHRTPSTQSGSSQIESFIHHIKLCEISAFASANLHSVKTSNLARKCLGADWEERVRLEVENAMKEWMASLPPHLRWENARKGTNRVFLQQSAFLYGLYHFMEIQFHRPSTKSAEGNRAICLNSAHASLEIIDFLFQKEVLFAPELHFSAATSAVMLLVYMWKNRQCYGVDFDRDRALSLMNVQKALRVLDTLGRRTPMAARICDILADLSNGLDFNGVETSEAEQQVPAQSILDYPTSNLRDPGYQTTSTVESFENAGSIGIEDLMDPTDVFGTALSNPYAWQGAVNPDDWLQYMYDTHMISADFWRDGDLF